MDDHEAHSHNPTSRTALPPTEAMELGFQTNLGPLSQIGIQLFSPETAVYLATKGLGWWNARRRVESLQQVLEATGASLAPIGAFNAERYSRVRIQHPVYGVARQGDERVLSRPLPAAGNIAYGNAGLWCLCGMATALLCFFDVDGASSILIEVLPRMLHYDQDDREIPKEGPLYSTVRTMVTQIQEEEKMSKATETLLRHIEAKRVSISPKCPDGLQDLQAGGKFDSALASAFLLWLAVPYSKRERQRYPTRSVLVWAIAEILEQLGFGIEVSECPVTTDLQYKQIFDEEGDALEVHFVPVNVGRTDPNAQPGASITVVPHVRLLPIRAIPITELRQYRQTQNPGVVDSFSKIWDFTFNHVQEYLRKQPHIQSMIGRYSRNTEEEAPTKNPLQVPLGNYQETGVMVLSKQHSRSSPESLLELLAPPIRRFVAKSCPDCMDEVHQDWSQDWCWSDDGEDETTEARKQHNEKQKLTMRTILLAAAYAVVCLFVKDENGDAGLNSEVAYVPSKGSGISDCFSLQSEDRDWVFQVFSIAAVGKAQKGSTRTLIGRVQFTKAIFAAVSGFATQQFIAPGTFGGYYNGITILSNFLLDPAHPSSYHTFAVSFGHPIDLPLDENSVINSAANESDLPVLPVQLFESIKDPGFSKEDEELQIRWDIEPDWANTETEIHFRCRLAGVLQTAIPPLHMMRSLQKSSATLAPCFCDLDGQSSSGQGSTQALAEYRQFFDIRFVPFTSIRRQGHYMRISLKPETKIRPSDKPTVVIMRPGRNSVEQWLALYTKMQTIPGRPTTNIRRFIGPCLSCGLKFVADNRSQDGSLALLVLSL
jgi:hypothetical protein